MNKEAALEYARKIGCRYYVKNSNGGLMGGFVHLEDAELCKAEWEKELERDPWNNGVTVYIEEKA